MANFLFIGYKGKNQNAENIVSVVIVEAADKKAAKLVAESKMPSLKAGCGWKYDTAADAKMKAEELCAKYSVTVTYTLA